MATRSPPSTARDRATRASDARHTQMVEREQLAEELASSRCRARRIAAAIEAAEASLVSCAMRDEPPTPVELRRAEALVLRKLHAKVGVVRERVDAERAKLRDALNDERTKLALAVSHGVDSYYTESNALHRERREAHGAAGAAAKPGSALRKLQDDDARLGTALRKLGADLDGMQAEEARVREARRDLKSALYRREGALEPAR